MAKYNVKLSCGHVTEMFLFGSESECKNTIAFWGKHGICPRCERERMKNENLTECDEVEMFYGEYKRNHPNCKTKPGSYNEETGVLEEAKEPYVTLEIETEEDWNRLQEMVTYWKNHHDEEGNEI